MKSRSSFVHYLLIFVIIFHGSSSSSVSKTPKRFNCIGFNDSLDFLDSPNQHQELPKKRRMIQPGLFVADSQVLPLSRNGSFSDFSAATTSESKPSPHPFANRSSNNDQIRDESIELDSFELNFPDNTADNGAFLSPSEANSQVYADVESVEFWAWESRKLQAKYDLPFRADLNGKTIVFDESSPLQAFDEFINNLILLKELNPIFVTAKNHLEGTFLKGSELNFSIDYEEEEDNNNRIPLHPTYRLAREILFYFVCMGNVSVVKMAVEAGMNLNFQIHHRPRDLKMNLLLFCCRYARNILPEMIEALIKYGRINPNDVDSRGDTPFHCLACLCEKFDVACALLRNGADPNLQVYHDNLAVSPIHAAAFYGNFYFLKPFIALEAVNINALTSHQMHIINFALRTRRLDFFSAVLQHPKVILVPLVVSKAFIQIKAIGENEGRPYLDAFVTYLIKSHDAHLSHLHLTIFKLINSSNITALEAFHRAGFDFNFIYKSTNNQGDLRPLDLAIHFDRNMSYQFLKRIQLKASEDDELFLALKHNSTKITEYLLGIISDIPENIDAYLDAILEADNSNGLKLFMDKFGVDLAERLLPKTEFDKHPRIFTFIYSI